MYMILLRRWMCGHTKKDNAAYNFIKHFLFAFQKKNLVIFIDLGMFHPEKLDNV